MGRRDGGLVVLLVIIIIALSALAGRQAANDDSGDPRASTFVRSGDGLAALYWTMEELDLPVARRTDPLLDADSLHGTLAIVAPLKALTEEETSVVMEHVHRGGTLLFAATGYDYGGAMYDSLGLIPVLLPDVNPLLGTTRSATARPHRWTAGAARVDGFRRGFRTSSTALGKKGVQTVLAVDSVPVVITWPLGRGRVIAVSDAQPLLNGRLEESGAAHVLVRALAEARDTTFFDEYHQGFSGDGSLLGGTLTMVRRFASGPVALQLLAAALLLLWAGGRRLGAPLQPPPLRRRSPLEHVEALAGAYRQAGARRTVRRLLLAGMARRLGRRAPADDRAGGEMLERMAKQSPVGREAAAELEQEWKRGHSGDLVALTRGVDRLLDEVRR
ncbi:DUF4350 domain-containing protein [Longimicrobium sp.]|uniref:DUF4350 domain-containing protein n=1 Tax=Longimicrobium sp. TaxID=2029185 RepID=UPI003B3BC773